MIQNNNSLSGATLNLQKIFKKIENSGRELKTEARSRLWRKRKAREKHRKLDNNIIPRTRRRAIKRTASKPEALKRAGIAIERKSREGTKQNNT